MSHFPHLGTSAPTGLDGIVKTTFFSPMGTVSFFHRDSMVVKEGHDTNMHQDKEPIPFFYCPSFPHYGVVY